MLAAGYVFNEVSEEERKRRKEDNPAVAKDETVK
jgi:hypothetical protein